MKPEQLMYCETHEWAFVESRGAVRIATVGISKFAVEQLTDLVFMQLPEVGRVVTAGEEFGEVESVKAVSPLFSPVSGTVMEVNTNLPNQLDVLGTDPYGAGWMIKVRIDDEGPLAKLMDYTTYQQQCATDH